MSQRDQIELERLRREIVRLAEEVDGFATDHGVLDGLADDDHTQYAKTDGTRGDGRAAGAIAFTPTGTIAATTVQAAIVEVGDQVATTQSGTSYTVDADDNGATVIFSNAALVTVTIPTGLTVGSRFLLVAAGALGLTLTTTGNTLIGSSPLATIAQNEGIYVEVTASNTLVLIGGTS